MRSGDSSRPEKIGEVHQLGSPKVSVSLKKTDTNNHVISVVLLKMLINQHL